MLIIFGFRARAGKGATGVFFCPHCGVDRQYTMKVIRRWFTLFFLPVIPLNKLGEHVSCDTCGKAYKPAVLELPTSAQLGEALQNAMRAAVVAMLRAGDPGNPAARAAAVAANRQAGFAAYDDTTIDGDLAQVDPNLLPSYLTPLVAGLKDAGRESFVSQVARVGLADGPLTPGESSILEGIGSTFQLSVAHLTGIVASVRDSLASPSAGSHDEL